MNCSLRLSRHCSVGEMGTLFDHRLFWGQVGLFAAGTVGCSKIYGSMLGGLKRSPACSLSVSGKLAVGITTVSSQGRAR